MADRRKTVALPTQANPADTAALRKIVQAASVKGGRDRPTGPDVRGRFDEPVREAPPMELSPATLDGLGALAHANPAPPATAVPEVPLSQGEPHEDGERLQRAVRLAFSRAGHSAPTISLLNGVLERLNTEVPLSEDEQLRKRVEENAPEIDVGGLIMQGFVTQEIVIVPGVLSVTFRTTEEHEDSYAEWALRPLVGDENCTMNELRRQTIRNGLALQIYAWNGDKWPKVTTVPGKVDPDAFENRLQRVHRIPSPLFGVIAQHLGWFNGRVGKTLTVAALGNG